MKTETSARNVAADAFGALVSGGFLRIYDGLGTVLAELRFASPAFKRAEGGVIVANPIARDESAKANGEPVTFRVFRSDGVTPVYGGEVGTDMALNTTRIQAEGVVSIDDLSYEFPG